MTSTEQNGTTSYYGTYGVTSQSEIDALGSGALWYPEDSGHADDDSSGGTVEGFYLHCVIDGITYYLTADEANNTLTTTTNADEKSEFYYDSLGELRVVRDGDDRVIISADGVVGLDVAEFEADTNDSRVYTLTETDSSGFAARITNTVSADNTYEIDILKYDASELNGSDYEGAALEGATLGLYNDEDCTDPVMRNGEPYTVTSDKSGSVIFDGLAEGTYYIQETKASDGYALSDKVLKVSLGEDLDNNTYYGLYGNAPDDSTIPEPGPNPNPPTNHNPDSGNPSGTGNGGQGTNGSQGSNGDQGSDGAQTGDTAIPFLALLVVAAVAAAIAAIAGRQAYRNRHQGNHSA